MSFVLLPCFTRSFKYPGALIESALVRLSRDPRIPEHLPSHWQELLHSMTNSDPGKPPIGRELVAALRQIVIAESARPKDPENDMFAREKGDVVEGDRSELLETLPSEAVQRITAMAASLFSAPIAIVSVVDRDRTWIESHYGPDVDSIARTVDLSRVSVPQDARLVVEDAQTDERPRQRTRDRSAETPFLRRRTAQAKWRRGHRNTVGSRSRARRGIRVRDREPRRPRDPGGRAARVAPGGTENARPRSDGPVGQFPAAAQYPPGDLGAAGGAGVDRSWRMHPRAIVRPRADCSCAPANSRPEVEQSPDVRSTSRGRRRRSARLSSTWCSSSDPG
jgi:hypothetical protein